MIDNKKQECDELHRTIWNMTNDRITALFSGRGGFLSGALAGIVS